MKKLLFNLLLATGVFCSSVSLNAQTNGTLTVTFSEVAVATASTYQSTGKHDLAVWIQTNAGGFIKTKRRYAGGGTSDHLPTWSVNAGGTSGNCLATACNTLDATTGATRSSWTTYTVTWDGKKGAAATGTLQADGVYKVAIQSTWNHGTTGTTMQTYTFTKGATADHQTPANNAFFTGVVIDWIPAVTGVSETENAPELSIYPNPTNGVFNVDFKNATNIKVMNMLGDVIYDEKIVQSTEGSKKIDLSSYTNGIYFVSVSNGEATSNHKIVLDK